LRHQSDPVHSGALGDIDHFGDLPKFEILLPTYEDHAIAAVSEEQG
jgi:hypothetical protein